jgi:hypothetical protein
MPDDELEEDIEIPEDEDDLGLLDEDEEEDDEDDLDPTKLGSLGFGVEEDDFI